jgi:hypothetical protein
MSRDIWDPLHFTPEETEKAAIFLKDSNLLIDRRSGTAYYPAKLLLGHNPPRGVERNVIVADTGRGTLTIISTSLLERHDAATLVLCLDNARTQKLTGEIRINRSGKRSGDCKEGKYKLFTARFKSLHKGPAQPETRGL